GAGLVRVRGTGPGSGAPAPAAPPEEIPAEPDEATDADTVLDVTVRRIEGEGPQAHRIWLPPLRESPTLDELLPLVRQPGRGLAASDPGVAGSLWTVVGIIDKPFEQRRDPMWLDLSGSAGKPAAVGGPRSGKSTLLRTLVAGLALTHTPREAQFYCLDFGGGTLAGLAGLPHVGGVASRHDANRVRRTVAELQVLL